MRLTANLLLASSLGSLAAARANQLFPLPFQLPTAIPVPNPTAIFGSQVQAKQLYRFNDGTWVENLAVRPNNQLILTSITTNRIFIMDPAHVGVAPSVAVRLPGVGACHGIAEVYQDQYLLACGNVSTKPELSLSAQTFFLADFGTCAGVDDCRPGIMAIPGRPPPNSVPNGAAAIGSSAPGVALVADSHLGVLYLVDTEAGTVEEVFSDPALLPGPGPLSLGTLGVNGIKVRHGYVYFTNSYAGILGRVQISSGGRPFGNVEVLANFQQDKGIDDFAISDLTGVEYPVVHSGLLKRIVGPWEETLVGPGGQSQAVDLIFPTSAQFARLPQYWFQTPKTTLYVTTGGLTADGNFSGGQIVQVESRL